ncbi:MAG: tetratricopeptide repeat protein [Elusimicrobiota bacterium]
MRRITAVLGIATLAVSALAASASAWGGGDQHVLTAEEDEAFRSASQLFRETTRDKIAAIAAFERFLRRFPESPRSADAQFMVGEAYMEHALTILHKEAESKKADSARLLSPKNPSAVKALKDARAAFETLLSKYRKKKSGLRPSAQYRLGEVAYNEKDWGKAIEEWRMVDEDFSKSYIVPESWMGIIFANLALEQFSQAEANLFLLGETYPHYLRVPEVLYVQGIISLHKGDYANASRALQRVSTPEAQFYLGKTYLLSKRPYLAAAAFESLARDYPDSPLIEETEFFIGDSFFLAKDFDGAITKYRRFLAKHPKSQLRVSALFRIGSSHFEKQDYVEARAHFQSVIDRYPRDFFAPLAQYFIAESHLVAEQFREGLFAYTKVITQYPETIRISPLAHYKLAWTQYHVGDYNQSAQTCSNFLSLYPTNSLAKNVYIVLANAQLAMKRPDDAVTSFQRIIDLAPTSDIAEQALFSILQTQYNMRRFNAILTSYQFIFRHLPPSQSQWRPLSYLYAAEAYLAMNRVDEAKAIYQMVLKVYPNDQAAFYAQDGLAWCYQFLGDDDRTLEERRKLSEMLRLARSSYSFSGVNQLGIADSMYNQKEYDEAYHLYDQFARENPEARQAPQALYRAAMSLYHLRYYTQAIEIWRRLRDNYPDARETGKAEYQIGDTLFRAQKWDEAIEQYKHVIDRFPESEQLPFAYLRVAASAFNAKDDVATLNGALALLSKFPDAPEATDALDYMEAVYDRSPAADFKKSLGAVVEAVPHTATAGEAQFRIGRRFFELKKYEEAAPAFQRFSVDYTGSPKLSKAQFLLAESYFNAEKFQDAVFAFERFLTNFPSGEDTPLALFHLGSAFYGLERHEQAVKNYGRLIEEYPESEYNKAAQFNVALAFKALGNLDRAQEAYARYANLVGVEGEGGKAALWEMFSIQRDRKDFSGAMGTLGRILDASEDGETIQEATYQKGDIYAMMGQPDEALRTWQGLVGTEPKGNGFRLQGLIKLGEEYEKREEFAKAASVYEDLAGNASEKTVSAAARERAQGLRELLKQKGQSVEPEPEAPEGEQGAGRAVVQEEGKTQVMPDDSGGAQAPASEKNGGGKKRKKVSKEINIPGMN